MFKLMKAQHEKKIWKAAREKDTLIMDEPLGHWGSPNSLKNKACRSINHNWNIITKPQTMSKDLKQPS